MSEQDGGEFDLGSLISQLGQVQQNIQQAQAEAAAQVVEGSSGGGAVKVRVTGGLDFLSVLIDPSVVDPDDVDMLQDLVLAAVRDGLEKASTLATSALGGAGLGLPGGGDVGDMLGGFLGPAEEPDDDPEDAPPGS